MKSKEILRKKSQNFTRVNKRKYFAIAMFVVLLWTLALLPLGFKEEKNTTTLLSAGESKAQTIVTQEILNDLGITSKTAYVLMLSCSTTTSSQVLGTSFNGVALKTALSSTLCSHGDNLFTHTINNTAGMNMYFLNGSVITLIERRQTGKTAEVLYVSDSTSLNAGYIKEIYSPTKYDYYRIYSPTDLSHFKTDTEGYLYCNMPGKTGNYYFTYQTDSNRQLGLTPTRDNDKTVNLAEIELTKAYNKYYSASGQLRSCYSDANKALLDSTYKTGLAEVKAQTTLTAKKIQIAAALAKLKAIVPQVANVVVDNASNSLSGLIKDRSYTISYENTIISLTSDNTGKIPLDGFSEGTQYDFAGKTLAITLVGNDYQVDSTPFNIVIPIRAEKPDGQGVADKNISVGTDLISIIVSPANAGEEYAVRNQSTGVISNWQTPAMSGDTLIFSPLVDGVYEILVRSKGDDTLLPSLPTIVGEPIKTIGVELANLKAELETARAEAEAKINNNTTLTQEDKIDLINKLIDKTTAARREIEKLASGSTGDGQAILANAKLEIEKVTIEAKLLERFKEKEKEIKDYIILDSIKLPQESIDRAIANLEKEKQAQISSIWAASTKEELDTLRNSSKVALDKSAAKGELEGCKDYWNSRLEGKKNELTTEEINSFKSFVEEKYTVALGEIDSATDTTTLAGIVGVGNVEMYRETIIAQLLIDKKTALEKANLINSNVKDELIADIEGAYVTGRDTILGVDAANSNSVANLLSTYTNQALVINKFNAKAVIEKAVENAIVSANKLTDPDKTASLNEIEAKKIAAYQEIDAITVENGNVNAVKNTNALIINKLGFKAELLAYANEAKKQCEDFAEHAVVGGVADAKNKIDAAYNTALAAIEEGILYNNAKEALDFGKAEIDKVIVELAKSSVINEINSNAAQAKAEIDQMTDLSLSDRETAKNAIDNEVSEAITNINNETKLENIINVKDSVLKDMQDQVIKLNLDSQKIKTTAEVTQIIIEEKNKIDQMGNMSTVEKNKFKDDLDSLLQYTKETINQAATLDQINTAKSDMQESINNIILEAQKTEAKNILEQVVNAEKDKIDQMENLSVSEKNKFKEVLDKTLQDTKETIKSATTLEQINIAKSDMQESINNIMIEAQKAEAKNILDQIANAEKIKIEALPGLTDTQKGNLIAEIDSALNEGKAQIDLMDKDFVAETEKITNKIENITKVAAKELINDYANLIIEAINNSNLTPQEKALAIKAVNDKVEETELIIEETLNSEALNTVIANANSSLLEEYKKVAVNELSIRVKDYTTINGNEGKYVQNYDETGKAQIELAVSTCKDDITAATSIEDIKNALANIKDDIIIVAPKAPQVNVDYIKDHLTGFKPDTVYIINDGTKNYVVTTDDSGNVALKDNAYDLLGKTLTITQQAIQGIQSASKPQENVNINVRPSQPEDITLIISADSKGTLSGVTSSMEYSTDGGESWTAGTGDPISNIDTGTNVLVRNKATALSPASQNKEFTVLPRETIPNVTFDKIAETLAIEGSGEFTITTTVGDVIKITVENGKVIPSDNGLKITPDGKIVILESWFGHDISIVKVSDTNNTIDSSPQIVHILPRAEVPNLNLDYINKVIETGQPNAEFEIIVDGIKQVIASDANGNIAIDSGWINKTIEIKQKGDGSSTSSSKTVTIMVESYWRFTINYNGNGTSAVSYSIKNGNTAPIQEAPQRNQYEFIGWFKDASCTIEWDFKYDKVKADTTVFAGWSKKHFAENEIAVTIIVEGKSKETITAVKNSFLKLDSPELAGKTFVGWYLDSQFTYQYDFNSKLTADITLYAKFAVTKIIITMPDETFVNLNYGDKLEKPSDPSQEGYIFVGWYTDANCNNQLIFDGDKTKDGIKENITLFAKWVEKTHNVTGQITDENGNPLKNVEVTIETQPTRKTVKTDKNGNFVVTNVADGTYQVVAKYTDGTNNTIVTDIITVDGTDIKGVDIRLRGANLNSSVAIGDDAPNIVVGGLNGLFDNESIISQSEKEKAKINGNKVELKLVVERTSANKMLDDFAKNANKVIGTSLDFTLYRVVTSAGEEIKNYISTLDSLLKAIVPLSLEMQNKTNYVIYRIHNGEIQEIHLGETNANEFGEYLELSQDKKSLVVYTKNFSSYSIAFDEPLIEVKSNCYVHWIVLTIILIFVILVTTFTILFGKKCLYNLIAWGIYTLSMLVQAFFVWHCTADIILWIVGIVLAILAVVIYLFYDKIFKEKSLDINA